MPRLDLLRKGINPLGILDELRELGRAHVMTNCDRVPPLDAMDPRNCYLSWTITLQTDAEPARLDEVFLFLDDRSQVAIEPLDPNADSAAVAATPEPELVPPGPVSEGPPGPTGKTEPAPRRRWALARRGRSGSSRRRGRGSRPMPSSSTSWSGWPASWSS